MAKTELFVHKQAGGMFIVHNESLTTGSIFFVHSGTGTDAVGYGQNPDSPVATIDYAIGLCTASKGDVIYVMPGHAETITGAAGIAVDIIGVSIIGLGEHNLRPTLTFDTSANADVNVSVANCKIKNIKFVSGINDLANFIDLDAGQFTVEDCVFVTSNTFEAFCFIDIATTFDDFVIRNCEFYQPTDPAGTDGNAGTGAIYCVDSENILVDNCRFVGQFETAILHNKTTLCSRVLVRDCELTNILAVPFVLAANSQGQAVRCTGETVIGAADQDADLFGTMGTRFWLNDCHQGNDSAAGGQMGAPGSICT